MTRYLLDTNIVSGVIRPSPPASLTAWMMEQEGESLFIASLSVAEIWRGLLQMPAGRKRDQLQAWFSGPAGPQALFAGRVLAFDEKAGLIWARLMADGKMNGRPRAVSDMIIAATALANGCTVVTANERDFAGIEVVNPLRSAAD